MGYSSFKEKGKAPITADQIGPGQIKLEHLAPELFAEIRSIALHNHSGTKSRRISLRDLEGSFGTSGFIAYSSDGSKRYRVQLSNAGAWVITDVT